MAELVKAIDSLENLSLNCCVEKFPIEAIRKHGPGLRSLCLREYDGIVHRPLRQSRYVHFGVISSCLVANLGHTTPVYSQFGVFSPCSVSTLEAARQRTQANIYSYSQTCLTSPVFLPLIKQCSLRNLRRVPTLSLHAFLEILTFCPNLMELALDLDQGIMVRMSSATFPVRSP